MDLNNMSTCELTSFLTTKDVSKEICDLLEENAIDGSTLLYLTKDITEFMTVLPKSGHRLKIKRALTFEEASMTKLPELQGKVLIDNIEVGDLRTLGNLTPSSSIPSIVDQPLSSKPDSNSSILPELYESNVANFDSDDLAITTDCTETKKACAIKSEQTPNRKRKDDDSYLLPENLPFPSNFSLCVEMAIKKGSILAEQRQIISDIGSFFFGMTSHPKQGDYKRMALLICKKFPELRDSNPSNYWLSIQKQLSQYFRNQRRYSANALSALKEVNGTAKTSTSTAKRVKLFKDDPEAQKRNLELLKNVKAGEMSEKTYSSLIDDTFSERQNFIKNTAKSSTEVLQMCPYLGNQENIRKEMYRILKKDSFKEAESRLITAFKSVLGKDEHLKTEDILSAMEIVEKRMVKRRPTSLIKFKDPSAKVDSMFRDKILQFRILCIGGPEDIQQIFITGEDQSFLECPHTDIIIALVDVISLYYVFDISYPDCMVGVLSFLQDIALECEDNSYKGTKYSAYMTELKSKMYSSK